MLHRVIGLCTMEGTSEVGVFANPESASESLVQRKIGLG